MRTSVFCSISSALAIKVYRGVRRCSLFKSGLQNYSRMKWRSDEREMAQGLHPDVAGRYRFNQPALVLKLQYHGVLRRRTARKWLSPTDAVWPLNAIEEKRSAQF